MKALDAIFGFVLVVGLAGLIISNPQSTIGLIDTGIRGTGYLTQVAQLRTPGQYLAFQ